MDCRQRFTLVCKLWGLIPFLTLFSAQSQNIKRQVIAAFGSSTGENGITVQMVAGQPSNTMSVSGNNLYMRQGFLQGDCNFSNPIISSITVFPNPTASDIYIKDKLYAGEKLLVSNLSGQIVLENTISVDTESAVINLQNLQSGMYLLNVHSDTRVVVTNKIIKY